MDQKMMQVLLILLFYPKIPSAVVVEVEEERQYDVKCIPPKGGTIWFLFRAMDNSGMEFIGSFSPSGQVKKKGLNYDILAVRPSESVISLTVKSFNKQTDSGTYSCASLVSGNTLKFGEITTLKGKSIAATKPPEIQAPTTTQASTTRRSCDCKNKGNSAPSVFCAPIILGPLAGGCGLLLLLLVVSFLYCNRIRTRRCPHHYKRKLRTKDSEKQMITNRHI